RQVSPVVGGRVHVGAPVLVGCASTSTDEAVTLARQAQESGANGVVVIPPYYWTPNDRAIETHIGAVAAAVDVPVVIYNFPAVVGRTIPPALVAKLVVAYANVLGIKEAVESIATIPEVRARAEPLRADG